MQGRIRIDRLRVTLEAREQLRERLAGLCFRPDDEGEIDVLSVDLGVPLVVPPEPRPLRERAGVWGRLDDESVCDGSSFNSIADVLGLFADRILPVIRGLDPVDKL